MAQELWTTPWIAVLAAIGLSLFCYAAVAGFGSWLPAKDRLEAIAMGLASQAFLFGTLGLFGAPLVLLTVLLLLSGLAGWNRFLRLPAGISLSDLFKSVFKKESRLYARWHQLTLALILIFATSRCLFALYPQLQADPLAYHVEAPKIWAQRGTIQFISWLPWGLQSGAFEYFYTLLAILSPDPVVLLLAAQVSHVIVGTLLSAGIIITICELVGLHRNTVLLVTLACLLFPLDATMMVRAKNDGATLFFSLMTVRSLLRDRPIWFCGLFAGAAVATKWSGLFFVVPLALFTNHLTSKKLSLHVAFAQATAIALGVIIVASPLALRNWVWTKNPIFPAMGHLFSSPELNPVLIDEVAKYTFLPTRWAGLLQKARWYLLSVPPLCLAVFLPIIRPSRQALALFGLGVSVLILFALVSGVGAGPRFALITVVLFAVSAGFIWERLAARFSFIPCLILIAMLVNTEFDVPVSNVFKSAIPFWINRDSSIAFISRINPLIRFQTKINALRLTPEPIILGCAENEAFFLNGGETIPFNHRGGAEALASQDPEQLAIKLKAAGMSHLLLKKGSPIRCWEPFFRDVTFPKYFQITLEDPDYALYHPAN